MIRNISGVACRFPLAVAAIVAMACVALCVIHGDDAETLYRMAIFLGVTLTASVAAALALEERSRTTGLLTGLGLAALWGVRCLFFPADPDDMTGAQWVEAGVVVAASFFAVFFAGYLRRDSDAQWWNFTLRTVARLALGIIFSAILFGGFMLAVYAVGELFGLEIPDELAGDLSVACYVVFAPLYVLAGVPASEAKHDPELQSEPILKVLGLYILGPILAVYTLILYSYMLKIVVTWELPDGWVSWLVTVLGAGGLAVALLLYPHRMRGGNRIVDFLGRWTGVIIAPLLVLMTVGIARRVSDYGWTPNRAYILLLNLWFYGIYIWLFIVKGRRVKWILISAVAVAFVSSVGPWSLARITPRTNSGEVVTETVAAGDEGGEWFSSDSTLMFNIPQELDRAYGRFARIVWGDGDARDGKFAFSREGDELVIHLEEDGCQFRLPLQETLRERVIRGEGFMFIVSDFYGTRYPARDSTRVDSIEIYNLNGYLFFNPINTIQ